MHTKKLVSLIIAAVSLSVVSLAPVQANPYKRPGALGIQLQPYSCDPLHEGDATVFYTTINGQSVLGLTMFDSPLQDGENAGTYITNIAHLPVVSVQMQVTGTLLTNINSSGVGAFGPVIQYSWFDTSGVVHNVYAAIGNLPKTNGNNYTFQPSSFGIPNNATISFIRIYVNDHILPSTTCYIGPVSLAGTNRPLPQIMTISNGCPVPFNPTP